MTESRSRHITARGVVLTVLVQLSLAYLLVGAFVTLTGEGRINRAGNPIGTDFVQYYSVSALARAGTPAAAYDTEALYRKESEVIGAEIEKWPWFYPPTFLVVVFPFSIASYPVALAVWLVIGGALYAFVAYRVAPHPAIPLLAMLFPAAAHALFTGQNGLLNAALLGGGLLLLERRPVLAGVLFGLLSYKPHLGLLVPVALIAGGHWRSLGWAAATALAFAGSSAVLFGLEPWRAFLDGLPFAREALEQGLAPWFKMPSVFAGARLLGGGVATAWALQVAVALGAAWAVATVWRRELPLRLRAAVLIVALPLATPYVQFYDLAVLVLAVAWLTGERWGADLGAAERYALTALWIAPVAAWWLADWTDVQIWPLVLGALLVLLVRRAGRGADSGRRPSASASAPARRDQGYGP